MQESTSSRLVPCGEKATVKDEPIGGETADGEQPCNSKQTIRIIVLQTLRLDTFMASISPCVLAVIADDMKNSLRLRKTQGGHVFLTRKGCVSGSKGDGHMRAAHHAWRAVCKKAWLTGWRIHDLRHAFASVAVNSGHSLPQIGALLGHTQAMTTARYAHIAANPVHTVAEDTGAKRAALKAKPRKAKEVDFKKSVGRA